MTIRDIAVAFGIEVDQKSVGAAENAIKGVKNMASKLLGAIGIGFSIAGIANLAEAAADAEALKSQFSQVFGDLEQDASDKLDKIADETGVTVNRMKGSFTQIAAFAKTTGMEQADALDIADRSMKAVADSAAFYDRSIEDVTNSLQSFLKGNFENDAALGLSCTETTRNTAANALYGKSFKDLSEAEKQLTLLQMVEDANKASGAIGQAARESDTWTNQLGNLKQNVQDLKAAAGNAFLKPAVMVLKLLNSLVSKATVGMKKLTSETGILTKAFNGMHALVKRLKPAIDRMMQTLQIGAKKGMGMVKNVIDKLGGVDNALKLLHISFSVEKSTSETANTAKVQIWNLSPANLNILDTKDCAIELQAGYANHIALILAGNVVTSSTEMDGADRMTEIEVVDGRVALRDTYISISRSGKVNSKEVFDQIAGEMGVSVVYSKGCKFKTLPHGFSYVGAAKTALKKLCKTCGLKWSIQNSVLQIRKPNEAITTRAYAAMGSKCDMSASSTLWKMCMLKSYLLIICYRLRKMPEQEKDMKMSSLHSGGTWKTIYIRYPKNLNAIIIRQTYTIIFMCMSQNCEK